MGLLEAPPFGRGETYFGGATPDVTKGVDLEGREWWFTDNDWSAQGAKPQRTGRLVRCRCVRNVSGINLLPSRGVNLQKGGTDGRFYTGRADAYSYVTAQNQAYPVDEFLPAAGVANNDLFWVVVSGPAKVILPLAGADFITTSIAVGDPIVAATAVTSQATSAGRFAGQGLAVTQAPLAQQVMGIVGYALSAVTSGQTNTTALVDLIGRW